eukprot:7026052-Pyramimonas_sp.AAC.1
MPSQNTSQITTRHNTILHDAVGPTPSCRVNLVTTSHSCPQTAGVFQTIPHIIFVIIIIILFYFNFLIFVIIDGARAPPGRPTPPAGGASGAQAPAPPSCRRRPKEGCLSLAPPTSSRSRGCARSTGVSPAAPSAPPAGDTPRGLDTSVQYSTVQHSTAQHSTAQHSTVQHSTAPCSTVQHRAAQYSTVQHSTATVSYTHLTLPTILLV